MYPQLKNQSQKEIHCRIQRNRRIPIAKPRSKGAHPSWKKFGRSRTTRRARSLLGCPPRCRWWPRLPVVIKALSRGVRSPSLSTGIPKNVPPPPCWWTMTLWPLGQIKVIVKSPMYECSMLTNKASICVWASSIESLSKESTSISKEMHSPRVSGMKSSVARTAVAA